MSVPGTPFIKPSHATVQCSYYNPADSTQCQFGYGHPGPHSFDATKSEGRKDDSGKPRYDLIPPMPLDELAKVYTMGAAKYGDRNWERGMQFGRVFAALMRHAWAWWRGEKCCSIDGQHHLASVAWCAFALMELEVTRGNLDDRPTSITQYIDTFHVTSGRIDLNTDDPHFK